MEARCHKCKHKWDYKGKSKYYITCPRCYRKVKAPAKEIKEEVEEVVAGNDGDNTSGN